MNISIIGASGFVGSNLLSYLLKNTNYNICAIAPELKNIKFDEKYKHRVNLMQADASNYNQMKTALVGTDVAYFFVHMLSCREKFYEKETQIAEATGKALLDINVKRVIYMSGLGNDKEKLSEHLASRHNTGKILRKYINKVIEFRASMIIGKGSASFEIIRDIVNKAPIILLPKKAITKTQPITIQDTLLYLVSAIDLEIEEKTLIEIGGPEIMSYQEFLEKYRKFSKKKTPIIRTFFLPEKIAGWFLSFFTTKNNAQIGQNMIASFQNEMIVTNNKAKELFPKIKPQPIEKAFL